jgi:uncharacterized membrane protein
MKLARGWSLFALAGVAAAIALAFSIARPGCTPVHGEHALTISSQSLRAGGAGFFCYRDEAGRRLRFVLARGNDGKLRSVMDACKQCYTYHKGFSISDGFLVCRLCGNRYPINHMLEGKASCVPVALPAYENGGTITIRPADVKKFAWLF